MFVICQKIQTRKDLQVSSSYTKNQYANLFCLHVNVYISPPLQDKIKKVKVKKETANSAAIYKFETKRKR